MARQTSTITVTGKLGNLVGRKGLYGAFTAGIYQPDVSNPKTALQTYQRSKMALAAKVAGMLGVMGQQINVANGLPATRRGSLVRSIMAHIEDHEGGPRLGSALPLVLNPKAQVSFGTRAVAVTAPTAAASGSLAYSYEATVEQGEGIRYLVACLYYDPTLDEWRNNVAVQSRPAPVRTYVPFTWKGHTVNAYCYVLAITTNPMELGTTGSMGSLEGTDQNFTIAVGSDTLYGNNIAYTQVDAYINPVEIRTIGG